MTHSALKSPPHRWRLEGNYLLGITADRWHALLRHPRFAIDPDYWYRAGAIALASYFTSLLAALESWRYEGEIATTELVEDPVFILGHWRSGTTLLHELLALDTERFAGPSTYQVMSPQTFLLTEKFLGHWLAGLVPARRPMDAMPIDFNSPQEDEFALSLLALQSYYLALSFPRAQEYCERYLTLEDLSANELRQWQEVFLWFLKKLTFKHRRQLVLKSPPHTARIAILLRLFPRAKFIHIHRHPYRVFQSMRHYFATAGWLTCLQKPDPKACDRGILRRYRLLYEAYFAQKNLIPKEQFCEVRFTDLERDPMQQLQAIYRAFGFSFSEGLYQKLRGYLKARQDYRKNTLPPLGRATKEQINRDWQRSFSEWGYAAS